MTVQKASIVALGLLFTQLANAEILFEGFYRIERNGRHAGYVIARLTHDAKAKTKTMTTYIRTPQGKGEVYESVTATAKDGSASPVSSVYLSSNTGATLKTTSNFKGKVPYISFEANSASRPQNFEKGTPVEMLSSFLYLSTDIAKMVPGKVYDYTTFVEQRGRTSGAKLQMLGSTKAGDGNLYHMVNDSFGQPTESFVSASGEPLGSRSMIEDVVCFWVPDRKLAIGEMEMPNAQVTKIFGDLPEGKKNSWSKIEKFDARVAIESFKKANDPRRPSSSAGGQENKLPGRPL